MGKALCSWPVCHSKCSRSSLETLEALDLSPSPVGWTDQHCEQVCGVSGRHAASSTLFCNSFSCKCCHGCEIGSFLRVVFCYKRQVFVAWFLFSVSWWVATSQAKPVRCMVLLGAIRVGSFDLLVQYTLDSQENLNCTWR